VALDSDFSPKHEIGDRHLVTPDEFLDRLFWGRKDPKAPMLLERALEIEQNFAGSSSFGELLIFQPDD
jgi:hypothetical protein